MAPGTGLTARQKQFLEVVLEQRYILQNFYLSGGTALSSWYLHHRESYDLDFFSLQIFDGNRIAEIIRRNQAKIGFKYLRIDDDFGFYTFIFRYPNNETLKVDFNHCTNVILKPPNNWCGLNIDSLYDITVNKFETIAVSPRDRDYVDFYLTMKQSKWNIVDLYLDAKKKFLNETDYVSLSKNFLKVKEYSDYPKMLAPFSTKAMVKFYEDQVRLLKNKIFK